MKSLKHDLVIDYAWCKKATIPAGTKVIPATNIPESGKYWIHSVPASHGLELQSWVEHYGILINEEDVI